MLELIDVSKTYHERQVVAPLNLKVGEGQVHVLIGPSGCGKSTLLRLMIGLIHPDTGTVYFRGNPLTEDLLLASRRRMGYVIQDGGLFPHLTAEQNVALMARHLGWDKGRISERITELCGLTHFPKQALSRYPVQISGGQQQRVSLMRALMLDPDVLLLDEPLGALDPLIRSELQNDLREIFRTLQKTVVLVTHDLFEAGFFANTITLMRQGHVVQQGSLSELMTAPADPFVTTFINAQRRSLV